MSSFYIILPSNTHPGNLPQQFNVQLPKSLHFNSQWLMGVSCISYPHSWPTIDNNEFIITKTDDAFYHYKISSVSPTTPMQLKDELNEMLLRKSKREDPTSADTSVLAQPPLHKDYVENPGDPPEAQDVSSETQSKPLYIITWDTSGKKKQDQPSAEKDEEKTSEAEINKEEKKSEEKTETKASNAETKKEAHAEEEKTSTVEKEEAKASTENVEEQTQTSEAETKKETQVAEEKTAEKEEAKTSPEKTDTQKTPPEAAAQTNGETSEQNVQKEQVSETATESSSDVKLKEPPLKVTQVQEHPPLATDTVAATPAETSENQAATASSETSALNKETQISAEPSSQQTVQGVPETEKVTDEGKRKKTQHDDEFISKQLKLDPAVNSFQTPPARQNIVLEHPPYHNNVFGHLVNIFPDFGTKPFIENAPNTQLQFVWKRDFQRFQVFSLDEKIKEVYISPKLAYILGFKEQETLGPRQIASFAPDLKAGITQFGIYTKDLTENVIVGDRLTSLVRIVSIESRHGEMAEKIYDTPMYVKVASRDISAINIEIRSMDGELINFTYGPVIVTLHFKKLVY